MSIREQLGSLEGQAFVHSKFGFIHELQGNRDAARDYLMKSAALCRRMGLSDDHAALRKVLRTLEEL